MSLPAINITILGENGRESTIKDFCRGKIGVIDLWHTKCQKCPAALDKMNSERESIESDDVVFIACALSLGSGNKEDVADLALETWENLSHIFIEEGDKDAAKEAFGYTAVPFYIIFDRDGSILKMGDSKVVNYMEEIRAALGRESTENATSTSNTSVAAPAVEDSKVAAVTTAMASNVFTLDEDF